MYLIKLNKDNNVDDRLEKKLYEHESKLVKVETILERVAINQDKMAEAVAQISTSIIKQELILEKLSHLETNAKGSFERIHNRIDKLALGFVEVTSRVQSIEDDIESVESTVKVHNKNLEALDVFRVIKKYPYISVLSILGLYSLTLEPVRDTLGTLLGIFGLF